MGGWRGHATICQKQRRHGHRRSYALRADMQAGRGIRHGHGRSERNMRLECKLFFFFRFVLLKECITVREFLLVVLQRRGDGRREHRVPGKISWACYCNRAAAGSNTVQIGRKTGPPSFPSRADTGTSQRTAPDRPSSSCTYSRLSVPLARDLHRALANKDKSRVHRSGNVALSVQVTVEEHGPE
jgi:hypothetical protein